MIETSLPGGAELRTFPHEAPDLSAMWVLVAPFGVGVSIYLKDDGTAYVHIDTGDRDDTVTNLTVEVNNDGGNDYGVG